LVGHRQQAARHAGAAEGGPRRGQGRQGVTLETVVFGLVALALLGGSLGVVLTPNLFHAVLSLAGALVATAVIFLLLDAAFLFAVQLLLYAGGVVTRSEERRVGKEGRFRWSSRHYTRITH